MFVEVLEVQSSVHFKFCIDEEFIEIWLAYLVFDSPHAPNSCRTLTFNWWSLLVMRDHSGRVLGILWIHIFWRGILFLTHHISEHCIYLFHIRLHLGIFRIYFLHIRLPLVKLRSWFFIQTFHDKKLVSQLIIRLVSYT